MSGTKIRGKGITMFYLVRANVGEPIKADKLIPFETLDAAMNGLNDPRVTRGSEFPGNYAAIIELSEAPYGGLRFHSDDIKAEWWASKGWKVKGVSDG